MTCTKIRTFKIKILILSKLIFYILICKTKPVIVISVSCAIFNGEIDVMDGTLHVVNKNLFSERLILHELIFNCWPLQDEFELSIKFNYIIILIILNFF